MAIEIERKFLVSGDDWRGDACQARRLSQFYLASGEDRTVRVRIVDDRTALLTMKFGPGSLIRHEFEYPVPLADARAMRRFALGRVIDKTRHLVAAGRLVFDVDEFHGPLAGLVTAELESPDAVAVRDLPSWIGREVTDNPAYLNSALALRGLPEFA